MLTHSMKKVLDYIEASTAAAGGVCPSYAEICAGTGVKSKGNLSSIISKLVERGHIRRLKYRSRAIEVIRTNGINGTYCQHCGQPMP